MPPVETPGRTEPRPSAPAGWRAPSPSARPPGVTAYLFLAPGLLLFLAFRVYPLLEGLRLSFTNARLGRPRTPSWGSPTTSGSSTTRAST